MATLQKLLWTKEYSDLSDEVVLVESRFVLERKHGECMCMVHAGLTRTVVLIAEENVASNADHLRTVVVSSEAQTNEEYLHLAHLFPLENTKLSTRRHQEHRGEHVLRLRISTGKTWYLELADGRHREDRWREWLSWIHDLDNKRQERRHERHLLETKQRNFNPNSSTNQNGNGNFNSDAIKPDTAATKTEDSSCHSTIDNKVSIALLAADRQRKRRDSRAYHWVGHFGGALSRDHDGDISAVDPITHNVGHQTHLPHPHDHDRQSYSMIQHEYSFASSSAIMDRTVSLVWQQPSHLHSLPVKQVSNSSTDTFSSLEDIESVGSLLGDASVDWMHPELQEINRKLLLCVGDLFQKFNIEAHGHGHVGRWRPMVSLTAVGQLRDSDRGRLDLPGISEMDSRQRRCSLPDVLEGEASFLDDMHQAADAAHRESLVYMDLLNEDNSKTPHVVSGHVMLLSPGQTGLLEEIVKCREMSPDLEFILTGESHDGVVTSTQETGMSGLATVISSGEKPQRKRRQSVVESLKGILHLRSRVKHGELIKQQPSGHLSTRILQGIRKHKESRSRGKAVGTGLQQLSTTIHEISPELLAMQLTLVDSRLFVSVREAELVDCLWLKGARHSRAPHTLRFIEFFERVVGLVSTEILLQATAQERAATLSRFVEVAEWCRILQNFHSLKAVLCGLKVLPVYRLKKTWQAFEEDFPVEFSTWNELVCLMADDGRCDLYKMAVKKSMRSPPCLPFFGTYLWRVADHYSAVDRSGMRCKSRRGHGIPSSSSSCSSNDDQASSEQESNDDTNDVNTIIKTSTPVTQVTTTPHQTGFFGTFASAWHTLRHNPEDISHTEDTHPQSSESGESETIASVTNHSCGMTCARRAHIRRLVICYAKRIAEESGMVWRAGEAITTQDLVGLAFFAGVGSPINWGSLFAKVKPAGMPTPSREETEESEGKKNAEYALYEMLFTYQMAAVQYRHNSDEVVRAYLLRAHYNTDKQNYKLSVSREPPSD